MSTVILLLTTKISVATCEPLSSDDEVLDLLAEAYKVILEVENSGGDILQQIKELNRALELLDEGKIEESKTLVEAILVVAPILKQAGLNSIRYQQITVVSILILFMISVALVGRFGGRVFWILWLRSKKRWKVHTK